MKKETEERLRSCAYILFVTLLILYPLRHVSRGVDLWDGGYNYANFTYPGTRYMDSMWYYATWIATEAGALLVRLPFADAMLGANVYTGLIVSLLAAAGFFFCTKTLELPAWLAFLGELAACGLCWAPTSVLYNYLTFVLLLFATVFLYKGLVREKTALLAAAGALLGLNVGVRFSNLTQAALIVAVWSYCAMKKKKLRETAAWTAICFAGYLGGLCLFLGAIALNGGLRGYLEGIARLFAMTDVAEDYAPLGMLEAVAKTYFGAQNRYWIKRFGLALVLGTAVCLPAPRKAARARKLLCVGVVSALFYWLLTHLFSYPDPASYESIVSPCVMLLLLAALLSVLFLFRKSARPEEKLVAVLEILTIALVSVGGNNAVFYNINNMFLVLPFLMFQLWKLWLDREDMAFFAVKTVTSALALLVCVLAFRFGWAFSYEEAAGGRDYSRTVAQIPALRGMKTGAEKAGQLEELYLYLQENGLLDSECVLYGEIPGISYYMGLAPALNVWADLRSYTPDVMRRDLGSLRKEMADGGEAPVIILEAGWADYLEQPGAEAVTWDRTALQKGEILKDFMDEYCYSSTFGNGKFVLYEKKL